MEKTRVRKNEQKYINPPRSRVIQEFLFHSVALFLGNKTRNLSLFLAQSLSLQDWCQGACARRGWGCSQGHYKSQAAVLTIEHSSRRGKLKNLCWNTEPTHGRAKSILSIVYLPHSLSLQRRISQKLYQSFFISFSAWNKNFPHHGWQSLVSLLPWLLLKV